MAKELSNMWPVIKHFIFYPITPAMYIVQGFC